MKKKRLPYQLTNYPIGSIREIFLISLPLMLSLLSNYAMIFIDRLFLSWVSIDVMNSATIAGSGFYAFLILALIIAGISEIFVGQYHGEEKFSSMGSPAWQMIWFSLFVMPIYILIAIFLPKHIFGDNIFAIKYFSILISFTFFFCASQAMSGFFVGQGNVKIILIVNIIGNIVNIVLDYCLIFGVWIFPKLSIVGAAYATGCSQLIIFILFSINFLLKKRRRLQGTNKWKFKASIFAKCIKYGLPAGIAHTAEFLASFAFFLLMNKAGTEYLTISSIIQSVYIFIFFIIEGLSKGVTAITSNIIGAKKYDFVWKNLKSTFKLHLLFFIFIFITFILFSQNIFDIFLNATDATKSLKNNIEFENKIFYAGMFIAFLFFFDGFAWAVIGMLTGAGDTKFIMKVGTIAPIIGYILPIYVGRCFFDTPIEQIWVWIVFYTFMIFVVYFVRFKSGKWKYIQIMK